MSYARLLVLCTLRLFRLLLYRVPYPTGAIQSTQAKYSLVPCGVAQCRRSLSLNR